MMESQYLTIGDYSVCLQFEPEDFGNLIAHLYPCARSQEMPGCETSVLLKVNGCCSSRGCFDIGSTSDHNDFFMDLEWQITVAALSHNRRFHQMHCAGALFGSQCAIIPGSSNAGKTSLTMELMRRGCKIFTDEVFLIDRVKGEFAAFPRSFIVKENTYSIFPGISHPKSLNGYSGWRKDAKQKAWFQDPQAVASDPFIQRRLCRQGAIFFVQYTRGSELLLNPLSRINVMKKLVTHSLNIKGNEESALIVLADLVEDFPGFELKFDSLSAAADCIFETLTTLKKAV